MTLNKQELTFTISIKELNVWMVALRASAMSNKGKIFPWNACPFLESHGELSRLTGYGRDDHQDLIKELDNGK